jgi:molybdopterin converting factor small subunit
MVTELVGIVPVRVRTLFSSVEMPVTDVRLPTVLRPAAGGSAVVAAEGATVGEVFEDLIRQHPGLKDQLLTAEGQIHRHLNIFLNDDDIRYLGKLDAKVGEADTLTLMPAVAGG